MASEESTIDVSSSVAVYFYAKKTSLFFFLSSHVRYFRPPSSPRSFLSHR